MNLSEQNRILLNDFAAHEYENRERRSMPLVTKIEGFGTVSVTHDPQGNQTATCHNYFSDDEDPICSINLFGDWTAEHACLAVSHEMGHFACGHIGEKASLEAEAEAWMWAVVYFSHLFPCIEFDIKRMQQALATYHTEEEETSLSRNLLSM